MSGELLADLLDCEAELNAANALPPQTTERTAAWEVVDAYCTAFVSDHLPELKRLLADEPRYTLTDHGRELLRGGK